MFRLSLRFPMALVSLPLIYLLFLFWMTWRPLFLYVFRGFALCMMIFANYGMSSLTLLSILRWCWLFVVQSCGLEWCSCRWSRFPLVPAFSFPLWGIGSCLLWALLFVFPLLPNTTNTRIISMASLRFCSKYIDNFFPSSHRSFFVPPFLFFSTGSSMDSPIGIHWDYLVVYWYTCSSIFLVLMYFSISYCINALNILIVHAFSMKFPVLQKYKYFTPSTRSIY